MTVWNLGSINIDRFYGVPHLPAAGETLAATTYSEGLGGKGANMSVAIARAAARVCHIGAVGPEGRWAQERLLEYGVDTRHIQMSRTASGHAIIYVDDAGENQIVLYPGANADLSMDHIRAALSEAETGDIFLTQNETNAQVAAASLAKNLGLTVVYAAAPFNAEAAMAMLAHTDLLVLNAVEAEQLKSKTGKEPHALGVANVVVTLGAEGALWYDGAINAPQKVPVYPADVVDTTGAGDTFTGYLVAALDRGFPMLQALDLAAKAGSIMVSRHGTADVIPDLKDIEDRFLP